MQPRLIVMLISVSLSFLAGCKDKVPASTETPPSTPSVPEVRKTTPDSVESLCEEVVLHYQKTQIADILATAARVKAATEGLPSAGQAAVDDKKLVQDLRDARPLIVKKCAKLPASEVRCLKTINWSRKDKFLAEVSACLDPKRFGETFNPSAPNREDGTKPAALPTPTTVKDGVEAIQSEATPPSTAAEFARSLYARFGKSAIRPLASAANTRGYRLHQAGKSDDALPLFIVAAEIDQTYGMPRYNAARIYATKGDAKNCAKYLQELKNMGRAQRDRLNQARKDEGFKDVSNAPEVVAILGSDPAGGGSGSAKDLDDEALTDIGNAITALHASLKGKRPMDDVKKAYQSVCSIRGRYYQSKSPAQWVKLKEGYADRMYKSVEEESGDTELATTLRTAVINVDRSCQ